MRLWQVDHITGEFTEIKTSAFGIDGIIKLLGVSYGEVQTISQSAHTYNGYRIWDVAIKPWQDASSQYAFTFEGSN